MSVNGIGGGALSVDRIMAMRQQILEKNQALSRANQDVAAPATAPQSAAPAVSNFADTLEGALGQVNRAQHQASNLSAAYERGETIDIAKVMLARQQASVGFEATLQVRNKLLSAYKDIMSMPV
ncbi:flagellar hook-basal body complex protein FliE [Sphingomonas sp.]|uniref:flagellar hook-basal body complex protein FliE n=1 Tax=Sphingomonas sp. TaxID=28214 RepID=UPI002BCF4391|nr:flagellar hook-basal body complex protein FliE [Sphingomonas sp.]HTG37590.1 flagellar hook-basal body complex protein FliE [Sphingomonas sp.]